MDNDLNYCRRRALEERAAARNASSPRARHAHFEKADQYDDFARAIAASERPSSRRFNQSGQGPFAGHAGLVKESPHNRATIDEFDRERMGIAAKE